MSGRYIDENVKRRLYAESMGYCMNPNCRCNLFAGTGDIIEKAHIDPYCKTADNSFENLVLLCPNCHTNFDKNNAFTPQEILSWKKTRQEELKNFFEKKFTTFEELEAAVVPLLMENKTIYENYYKKNNKKLWDKFEPVILINNRKLKLLLKTNLNLIQKQQEEWYSNLASIHLFMAHIEEFEATRGDDEKNREILFPVEINSIFGVVPVEESLIPSTECLELLIKKLKEQEKFVAIEMGVEHPCILMVENNKTVQVFLDDAPRLRQIYYNYKCFKKTNVRLESLNFALKYIRNKKVPFKFINDENLREISINHIKMIFVYEYCLGQVKLMEMLPEEDTVIVNLHNWNGESCISRQAYERAEKMNVKLLTISGCVSTSSNSSGAKMAVIFSI